MARGPDLRLIFRLPLQGEIRLFGIRPAPPRPARQRFATYIVISMPNRRSVACGVSHFMPISSHCDLAQVNREEPTALPLTVSSPIPRAVSLHLQGCRIAPSARAQGAESLLRPIAAASSSGTSLPAVLGKVTGPVDRKTGGHRRRRCLQRQGRPRLLALCEPSFHLLRVVPQSVQRR